MKIQILGMGCPKCEKLKANAVEAAEGLKLDYTVEKISDMAEIMKMNVMSTPALAVDGKVLSTGKLLSVEEIGNLLKS